MIETKNWNDYEVEVDLGALGIIDDKEFMAIFEELIKDIEQDRKVFKKLTSKADELYANDEPILTKVLYHKLFEIGYKMGYKEGVIRSSIDYRNQMMKVAMEANDD